MSKAAGLQRIAPFQPPEGFDTACFSHRENDFLNCCGGFDEINWDLLVATAQGVLLRLIVDKDARAAHFDRLAADDLQYHETAVEQSERFLSIGLFDRSTPAIDYFLVVRDFDAIEYLAEQTKQCSLICWLNALSESLPKFAQNDHGDLLAARMYLLSKLCPE